MDKFLNSLNHLGQVLESFEIPIRKKLKPGIIVDSEMEGNYELPIEAQILYKWRNGTELAGIKYANEGLLFTMGRFRDFQTSKRSYLRVNGKMENFEPSMFPLFDSGGGDYYLIECDKRKDTYGMILYHTISVERDGIRSAYDSLENLIKTITVCYEQKIYTIDSNGWLDSDLKREYEVSRELNPGSKSRWYWPF